MRKITKVKFLLIIFLIIGLALSKVCAASISIKAEPDTSEVISNKVVYIDLSLTNFVDIDTSDDMAISGTVEYDKSIFKTVEEEAQNGWVIEYNQENGKFVVDAGSTQENQVITRFKFTIADNVTISNTQIKFTNVVVTNNDDLNFDNLSLTVNIGSSTGNQGDSDTNTGEDDTPQTPEQNPSDDNNNQGSTETPDAEDPSDDNQNNDQNNNQDEENPNDNNSEADDDQSAGANEIEKVEDLTVAKDPIPQTGTNYIAIAIIALVVLIGIIAFIRYKKYVQLMNKGV